MELNENHSLSVETLQRKALRGYLYLMSANLLSYLYISWQFICLLPFAFFYGFLLAGHISGIILVKRLSYTKIKSLIPAFMLLSFVAFCPLAILSHVMGNTTLYIWLAVVPTIALISYPKMRSSHRITFYGCFVAMGLVLFISAELLNDVFQSEIVGWYYRLLPSDVMLKNKMSFVQPIVMGVLMQCYLLYHYQEILKEQVLLDHPGLEVDEQNDADMIAKYNELYQKIVNYFETEKPYLDPKFSISLLSSQLNTNTAYVSRAIKQNCNMNFKLFVGTYRIEHAKELIRANKGLYTLEYIYTSSGFANQSTFNKLFRQIENVTPSEFHETVKEPSK